MALIETDLLLALSSEEDRHHSEAIRVLEVLGGAVLSPYSLVELALLQASGRIEVTSEFFRILGDVLDYFRVRILPPSPSHMARALDLGREFGLTFFDSLHAAAAIEEGEELVSFDPAYSRVRGLRLIRPPDLLR